MWRDQSEHLNKDDTIAVSLWVNYEIMMIQLASDDDDAAVDDDPWCGEYEWLQYGIILWDDDADDAEDDDQNYPHDNLCCTNGFTPCENQMTCADGNLSFGFHPAADGL